MYEPQTACYLPGGVQYTYRDCGVFVYCMSTIDIWLTSLVCQTTCSDIDDRLTELEKSEVFLGLFVCKVFHLFSPSRLTLLGYV